jgi:hypothetical protein
MKLMFMLDFKKRRSLRILLVYYWRFLIKKFPGPSVLGFYWIGIIPVLRPIFAVLDIYHEW